MEKENAIKEMLKTMCEEYGSQCRDCIVETCSNTYCDEDAYYYPEDCTEFFGKVVQECGAFGIGTDKELPLEFENWCNNDNFVSLWEIYWNLNCCDGELPMLEVVGNFHDNPELLE